MDAIALEAIINRVKAQPVPNNEQNAKMLVTVPILGALGWPVYDPSHVFFEQAAGSGRVDIGLKAEGRFVVYTSPRPPC